MKFSKMLAIIMIVACFLTTSVFAEPITSERNNSGNYKEFCDGIKDKKDAECKKHKFDKAKFEEFQKDPVKALENNKKELQTLVKEGKVTKEKAEEISKRLDSKIKEINEFNKLSLQEKKEMLKEGIKTRLDKKVKEGKISQEKANEKLKILSEKIENWDGKGYPQFFYKGNRKNK